MSRQQCGKCGTSNRARAAFCRECGSSLATVKAAAALRDAGYLDEPDPGRREVIYKQVSATAAKSAVFRDAEADALREALGSCDPHARLTAERELTRRGLAA